MCRRRLDRRWLSADIPGKRLRCLNPWSNNRHGRHWLVLDNSTWIPRGEHPYHNTAVFLITVLKYCFLFSLTKRPLQCEPVESELTKVFFISASKFVLG